MLRAATKDDLKQIRAWGKDPAFEEFFRRCPPAATWPTDDQLFTWFQAAHVIEQGEHPVGLVQLFNFDTLNRRAEIGVMVDPDTVDRRLVASEACYAIGEYAFGYLGLERVICHVLAHRNGLAQLLTLNGFKEEGLLRNNCFWKGEFHDERLFALLKQDFKKDR